MKNPLVTFILLQKLKKSRVKVNRGIMKKGPHSCDPSFRGPERVRTAVRAFAELCLTTRPQDLIHYIYTHRHQPFPQRCKSRVFLKKREPHSS
jgi:hypothetical protein